MQTFHLPDVGEGLTEAELVSWRVQPGDRVEINGVIAEIETAKSVVELPSPYEGVVGELLVGEGDTVDVGAPIIRFDAEGTAPDGARSDSPSSEAVTPDDAGERGGAEPPIDDETTKAVLVGYGAANEVHTRRKKKQHDQVVRSAMGVVAKPPVRKLARDLDVELAEVRGTGPSGEVTRQDVVTHAQQAQVFRNLRTPDAPEVREETVPLQPTITTARTPANDEERTEAIPVKGVRKATATGMVKSVHDAPHVSAWTDVDATRTMEYVKRLKASPDFADVRVSPLLIMARAVTWAVRRTPMVNSAWANDEDGATILVRHYVNLGIAAATPRGLLVPNIKDAQDLSMRDLARALNDLTTTAREGKTQPEALRGGTITITNIGVFGLDAATPIINQGETGIIAMGAIRQKPWVVDGEVRPRYVTTVSGSFDHRVIDGDKIGRFIADIAAVLEEPALLLD